MGIFSLFSSNDNSDNSNPDRHTVKGAGKHASVVRGRTMHGTSSEWDAAKWAGEIMRGSERGSDGNRHP